MQIFSHSNASRVVLAIKSSVRTAAAVFTLGIEVKQWAASMAICALLSPLFIMPSGVYATTVPANTSSFEPVNEDLPVWKDTWRSLNANMESSLIAWRPTNVINRLSADDAKPTSDKTTDRKAAGTDTKANVPDDVKAKEPVVHTSEDTAAETKVAPLSHVTAPAAHSAPAAIMNQLPTDEHDSVYSYTNNLGSPRGQVEMDSPNMSAALPIKHRVGVANFSFGLPLASIPGRGIDASVGMTYNSRTWNKSCEAYDSSGNCSTNHFTYDVEQSWIAPGFSSGYGYLESVALDVGSGLYRIRPTGITDSDGTRHRLTCSAWSGPQCTEFRANDGTFIRSSGDVVVSGISGYSTATFSVTYPNGGKVVFSGGFGSGTARRQYPLIIQDNNGNRLRIAYRPDQSGSIDNITDTVNRQIKFYYEAVTGAADRLVAVTIPGPGTTGEIQTIRFYYEDLTLQSGGFLTGSTVTAPTTVRTLKYVYMPGTKTGFKYEYNPYFGMISKITRYVGMTASSTGLTATGSISSDGVYAASTEYDYPTTTGVNDVPKYTSRTDDWQGNTDGAAVTTYNSPEPAPGADYVSTIETADDGFKVQNKSVSGPDGLLKETSVTKLYGPSSQYTQLMAKTEYKWDSNRNLASVEVTDDAGLKKATVFAYGGYNNQTEARECDYGVALANCSDSSALRRTLTTYETGSGWISANLLTLPKSVTTIVGGVNVSKTELTYDHAVNGAASDALVLPRTDIDINTHDIFYNNDGNHDAYNETVCPLVAPPGEGETQSPPGGCVVVHHYGHTAASAYRGNVTKVTRFSDATLSSDTNADVTEYNHDIAGNLVSATLSCCNLKTTEFGANFAVNGYAYPTSETKGSSPTQLTTQATYDKNTGLILSSTNENGQSTSYEYEADTLRPTKTTYPNTGYVLTEYSDGVLPAYVHKTTKLDATNSVQSYSYHNGRGLGIRTAIETATDGWLISAVEYDNLGRPRKTYNPFYGTSYNSAVPTGSNYSEVTAIDALGRSTEVRLQDGTKVNTYPNESTVTYTAPNTQSITGIATRVKDQADKERRQIVDALGRIVRVDEPTGSGLGSDLTAPNQPTYYEYDGNDNLSKVTQSNGSTTQERRFKYDSLSRLIAERQVEASPTLDLDGTHGTANSSKWTKVLKYDPHGLLTDGWDARGVHTQMVYDGLNRIQSVTYSGETSYQTPGVAYTYDQTRSNSYNVGALTKVETAASGDSPATKAEFDYDVMGWATKHRQWVGTQEYDLQYGYNLAGQMISETYPSGKVVTNSFDANGRFASVSDQSRTYLSGLEYHGEAGSLSSMNFGNGTSESFTINERMQMTKQILSKGSDVLQRYDYSYGTVDLSTGSITASKNNGHLAKIDSYIGTSQQWSQRFGYDELGRLTESREYKAGNNSDLTYKQKFDFDLFGNMYRKAAVNSTTDQQQQLPYTPIEDADISWSSNRFTTNTTYDEAGNVTADSKFRLMGFGYDANGRMVKATQTSRSDALSVFDAGGMRVAERVDDVWRFVVYDIGGKKIAEYGGMLASDEGGVKYLLSDWQGSNRAVLSSLGSVISRSDYTAFGEDIESGKGLRTLGQGYGSANTPRQKYGLTERDDATGMDHTSFRKHENRAGRWTGPDPSGESMSIGNPQSFNRYAYVSNQPTNFVDPSGLNEEPIRIYTEAPHWDWGFWWHEMFGWGGYITSYGGPAASGGGGSSVGVQKRKDCPAIPKAPPSASVSDNIREAYKHRLPTDIGSVLNPLGNIANIAAAKTNGMWFYDKVKNAKGRKADVQNGNSWDYKQLGSSFEAFGNFNFGATGAALGVPTQVLLRGAGAASIVADPSRLISGNGTPADILPSSYGDDPVDQANVIAGIKYYEEGCY